MRFSVLAAFLFAISFAACEDPFPLRDAVEFHPRRGLPNFFAKLAAGKEVHIAYLGGSITEAPGWRVKSLKWFQEQYPNAKISEINAAIGGTGSDLGVYRVDFDALQHKPDLLFVEFAVNDGGAAPVRIQKCMEGIVRKTWRADPATDICYVYTLAQGNLPDLQSGKYQRSASAMEALADHYDIPSIHLGVEVAKLEKEGKLIFKAPEPKTEDEKKALGGKIVFSSDGVHPLVYSGHEIYTQTIARCMLEIKTTGTAAPHALKTPLIANNLENAKMIPLPPTALSAAWEKLDPASNSLAKNFSKRMPTLYKASKPGTTLNFKFTGTAVGVYDLLGPDCGQIKCSIDGGPAKTVLRIDGYCKYHRLAFLDLGNDLENKEHTVSIELDAAKPDKAKILFPENRPDLEKNPAKYDGLNWYVGAIMLVGDLNN